MKLTLRRYHFGEHSTLGLLFIDGVFECYTLEDTYRGEGVKIPGETCIPQGRRRIGFRSEGGFHSRYRKRFGADFHHGMLEIKDLPTFKWVCIHCGNDDGDTAGCPLVGMGVMMTSSGKLMSSVGAYRNLYPKVAEAILSGEEVWIDVVNSSEEQLEGLRSAGRGDLDHRPRPTARGRR